MSRTLICGFESGAAEWQTSFGTGTASVSGGTRSSVYKAQLNGTTNAIAVTFQNRAAGGALRSLFQSVRFYLLLDILPTAAMELCYFVASGTASGYRIRISASKQIDVITDTSQISTGATVLVDSTWYLIEIDVGWSSGAGIRVSLNGVPEVSDTRGNAAAPQTALTFRAGNGGAIWIDDIMADDASFATSGFPGGGTVLLLKPTSDNNRGTWTGGVGGTTNLFNAIDNIPPVGTASETDTSQIENATNTANQDGTFNCATYSAIGISPLDKINAIQVICNHGEDVTTGTKTGEVFMSSNPSQGSSGFTFDFGDDVGALGTFPSGWAWNWSPVISNPSVTVNSAPVVAIRAVSATTRVRSCDFLGVLVDYTPAIIPKALCVKQAVNRASTY